MPREFKEGCFIKETYRNSKHFNRTGLVTKVGKKKLQFGLHAATKVSSGLITQKLLIQVSTHPTIAKVTTIATEASIVLLPIEV